MFIRDGLKKSLQIINTGVLSDEVYVKLLENCFAVLAGSPEIHNVSLLYNSKPDIVKEIYATLLSVTAEFVRNGKTSEEVTQYLDKECRINTSRSSLYGNFYQKNKQEIEISLLNIGSHLPHVTDVNWKIDYVVKTSNLSEPGGPLFRISLSTEVFNKELKDKKIQYINFTCNSLEMQDLVFKMKDAVRHCEKLAYEH